MTQNKKYNELLRRNFYFRGHVFEYNYPFSVSLNNEFYIYVCKSCKAKITATQRNDYNILGIYSWFNTKGKWTEKQNQWIYDNCWSYDSKIILCKNSTKGYIKFKREEDFEKLLM